MTSKVDKRRIEILHILETEGSAGVSEMAALFKVTPETIRNDFDNLSETYQLERVHGGLKKESGRRIMETYHYHQRQGVQQQVKRELCFQAMKHIEPGDCLYVDTGSTLTWLLPFMNRKKDVTIVTPSIALLSKYVMEGYESVFKNHQHRLIFLGGEVNSEILTTQGTLMTNCIKDFYFSKALFSVDAVDKKAGCMNVDIEAFNVTKSALRQGKKAILIADSTKFNQTATYRIAGWHEIDVIITDQQQDEEWEAICYQHCIEWVR
ncbi:DeoR/GlpR family DNA-binding transcription regulator [Anoxynatronum buryatiense]|uniref:Transcriptional regulator, DeoR family n=1 Tax=Anoxynatronum buryatiense TaxID=489973 RepID=A0AA46AHJ9_9CLOT|nr:DeoR/GlpR family DNA-binding transcription regulator [Anoxynatronum buryatiense]SMP40220.1 transcriptional regulator, DeoR family [Anoxynatronum buryatiense]